jgi:hypothetical protein
MDGPTFLVIGAHRSGISWLYSQLARHPEIHLPSELKELFFWSAREARGDDWYKEVFESPKKIRGDVNSAYATLPEHLIHTCRRKWPDLKLVYIARNPVERTWSAVRKKVRDFRLNHDVLSDAWFIGHFERPDVSAQSDAVTCVENWLRYYPEESLLVLGQEDLKSDPRACLKNILSHIGASAALADTIPEAELTAPVSAGPEIPFRPYLKRYLDQKYKGGRWFRTGDGSRLRTDPPTPGAPPDRAFGRDFGKHDFQPGEPKKLHLGCAEKVLPGWINTDVKARPNDQVLALDHTRPLQLADESFDRIFINGLPTAPGRALRLLADCRRVLRPQGWLRVQTLNFQFLSQLFTAQSDYDIQRYIVWYTEALLPNSDYYSGALVANDMIRRATGSAAHDQHSLRELFQEAGFSECNVMAPGSTSCPEFKDLENAHRLPPGLYKLESIAGEAVKPS